MPTQDQTYLFFAVDSFDCIGKNFSAWQACDRLEGTYGAVEEQGQRLRIAAKSIVDSLAFGGRLNSVELTNGCPRKRYESRVLIGAIAAVIITHAPIKVSDRISVPFDGLPENIAGVGKITG